MDIIVNLPAALSRYLLRISFGLQVKQEGTALLITLTDNNMLFHEISLHLAGTKLIWVYTLVTMYKILH